MVTADQLKIVQSPITGFISTISTSVTVKLDDSNYLTWSFQITLLFESHGIMGFVDGSRKCPLRFDDDSTSEGIETDGYLVWKMHDRALMQLIIVTLSPMAMSCIIGSRSFHEMWVNLAERFSTVTKATIFQMKTELQNIKKGSESVSVYLQKIKDARDHLAAAGVHFDDDDIIILALKGLPAEFNTFHCVIRGRENTISLKDFRSQLLAEETTIGQAFETSTYCGSAMVAGTAINKGKALVLDQASSHSVEFGSSSGTNDQNYKSNGSGLSSSGHSFGGPYNNTGSQFFNNGGHYQGGYKGNNFRGRGRGRSYYSGPKFYQPPSNMSPGILGAPRPFQSHCPDHPSEIPTCQICNKKGHVAADCFQRHSSQVTSPQSPVQCQICWKFGHFAVQCYHRGNFAYQGKSPSSTLAAMHVNHQPSAPMDQFWVADTGATSHMTSELANLDLSNPYHGSDTITTASGAGQTHKDNPSQGAV